MAADGTAVLATRDMMLYRAPFLASNAFPLDTLDFGAIASPYIDMGYTDGGLTLDIAIDRADITVDQVMDPILRPMTGRTVTFTTALAEGKKVANLNYAVGLGTVVNQAPIVGTEGHDTLPIDVGSADVFASYVFEAKQQDGLPFRGMIWRGQATGSPSAVFGIADTKTVYELEITALVDTSATPDRIAEFRTVLPALP